MRNTAWFLAVSISLGFGTNACAGFLDKLNEASQKIKQVSQQMPQTKSSAATSSAGEDPDKPLHLEDHYKGSCEGKRSATCMDYGELVDQCMDPLKGYRAKLLANLIEKKLKEDTTLSTKQRKNLEEDLTGLREAEENKSDDPTIAGQAKSQRYLSDISDEDQVCVNADYNTFYQKIYNKCMGADHMGTGKRTEMMKGETLTCEQAVAQYRAKKKKDDAPMECMKGVTGLRYVIMAEMMEKKMQTLKLSDKERAEWEADIAAVKKVAAEGGTTMPQSTDPANPMRPLMRLSAPEEQTQFNNEYMAQTQTLMKECSKPAGASAKSETRPKGTGLVDHSQSPSNPNAKKFVQKEQDLERGRGGSTNLLALRRDKGCADALKGHLAQVTADKLEAKLKAAGNLPAQKRKEWEEDIAAWRAAQQAGVDTATPPDPDNPYRWYDYVTNAERAAINKEHADFNNKIIRECNNRPSGL